jgi:hypothetical protein
MDSGLKSMDLPFRIDGLWILMNPDSSIKIYGFLYNAWIRTKSMD